MLSSTPAKGGANGETIPRPRTLSYNAIMDFLSQWLVSIIIVISFFAQAVFGFGGGLMAIPLTGLVIGVKQAVLLMSIFQMLMGLLMIRTYATTTWHVVWPVTFGMVIGLPFGLLLLAVLSETILRWCLALFIVAFLLKNQFWPRLTWGTTHTMGAALLAGLIFGGVQGLIGAGGPVLVVYLLTAVPDNTRFRSTLICIAFFSNVYRVVLSASTGLLNTSTLALALPVIPFFLAAIFLGQRAFTRLDPRLYQQGVQIILLISVVSLLLKA